MRCTFWLIILFFPVLTSAQKEWRFGAAYSFGGAWNFHKTNASPFRPTDVSTLGVIARLQGEKSLGFQAALNIRWNDVRNNLRDNYYLDNGFKSAELRLQLVMPIGKKSSLGFGIAPRLVYHNSFSLVYSGSVNGSHTESELEIRNETADLNELNSSLILSYQYELHRRWHFFINADQDIQPIYASDVAFENYDDNSNEEPSISINSFLTSITGSIVFWIK